METRTNLKNHTTSHLSRGGRRFALGSSTLAISFYGESRLGSELIPLSMMKRLELAGLAGSRVNWLVKRWPLGEIGRDGG
jgi:hypothetical protein